MWEERKHAVGDDWWGSSEHYPWETRERMEESVDPEVHKLKKLKPLSLQIGGYTLLKLYDAAIFSFLGSMVEFTILSDFPFGKLVC